MNLTLENLLSVTVDSLMAEAERGEPCVICGFVPFSTAISRHYCGCHQDMRLPAWSDTRTITGLRLGGGELGWPRGRTQHPEYLAEQDQRNRAMSAIACAPLSEKTAGLYADQLAGFGDVPNRWAIPGESDGVENPPRESTDAATVGDTRGPGDLERDAWRRRSAMDYKTTPAGG